MAKGNELATAMDAIEQQISSCRLSTIQGMGVMQQSVALAGGVAKLRELITPQVLAQIKPLQGSSLGFRTDKDGAGGYPDGVLKECFIEACLRGLYPVGNEFNIIAGRCYVTKEGLTRLVGSHPGLTDLKILPGVPAMKSGGAVVNVRAEFKLHGAAKAMERDIPIRVNQGMGVDAIIGKATRKMLATVYAFLIGSEHTSLPDGDVEDVTEKVDTGVARSGVSAVKAALLPSSDPVQTHPDAPITAEEVGSIFAE